MNDKQQLAAMGAQYRLTEEQAKALAERMPKTGALQVIDDEPLCMAKRIDETEFQKWCKRMLLYFQAAAEGKTVQVLVNGVWSDKRTAGVRGPHREYRIKPDDATK